MRLPHRVLIRPGDSQKNIYLPTFGYAGYEFDLARDASVAISGFEGVNAVVSDVCAFQALTRLIEGPIRSLTDIQAAESALKALVFHDHATLLNPGWHVDSDTNDPMIRRPAYGGFLEPFSGDQFRNLISDEVVVTEHVVRNGELVTGSSWKNSRLVGKNFPLDIQTYLEENSEVCSMLASYPSEFRLPAYFSDPLIQAQFSSDGFFSEKFYQTVNASVIERSSIIPRSTIEVRLPLLVWILLGRVNKREEIPDLIISLREEMAEARDELSKLDSRMMSAGREADRADIAKHYIEAFENIVKASGQSNFNYVKHVVFQLIEWSLLGLPAKAMRIFNPNWSPKDPRTFVRRSIAAKAFSELLDLENPHHILSIFNPSERAALSRKIR